MDPADIRFSFLDLVPRTRFCNRCGKPNISRIALQMAYHMKNQNFDNQEMMGLMSDMNKISVGEWKDICACLPVFAAINLPFR